jgi:hypothetical protein
MKLSDDNERSEYEAARDARLLERSRQRTGATILNLQGSGVGDDNGAWVPGQSGSDPDSDPTLNTPTAPRKSSGQPGDLADLLGTLNNLYSKIGTALGSLRNHIEKARVNPSGSTPARPFPNTGSVGTKNAFIERSQKMTLEHERLADVVSQLTRDLNQLRK